MKRTKLSVTAAVFLIAALGFAQNGSNHKKGSKLERKGNGIFVDEPKVYDDNALRMLEAAAATRLGQINPFDATSLINHLGAVQGATVSQSQFSVQANSIPIPGVTKNITNNAPNTVTTVDNGTSQKAGATAPDTTTDNKVVTNGATSQTQTQTTAPQVSPSVPALPSPPSFSLPSTFSVSSLNLLNEQMQLNAELIGFQLLSRGALSDANKFHMTLGFPITISVPSDYKYRNAVAQVEVSICNPPKSIDLSKRLSIVDIIPRERTYNIAAIVSKSTSLGGGVVAGVVSFGGNFLRGRQTYYLVQDQDTVALQYPPTGNCTYQRYNTDTKQVENIEVSIPAIVGWQFRPVLGRKVIQDGMKQTFVEIAFPEGANRGCRPHLFIRTGWRRYDAKTGRVGEWIDPPETREVLSKKADFVPNSKLIEVGDNGDGTLTVHVTGLLATVTRVRIGNVVLDDNSPGFERTPNSLKFTAPALAIALQGVKLIEGSGAETDLKELDSEITLPCEEPAPVPVSPGDQSNPQQPKGSAPKASSLRQRAKLISVAWNLAQSEPQPSKSSPQETPSTQGTETNWKISSQTPLSAIVATGTATIAPFSDTASLVTLPFSSTESPVPNKNLGEVSVVIIGARLFGLRDAPFKEITQDKVSLIVPNDVLRANQQATFQKLFGKNAQPKVFNLPAAANFAVSAVSLIVSADDGNIYAISGTFLTGLKIVSPSDITPDILANGTMAKFKIPKSALQGLKNLVVQNGDATPIIVALPTGTADPPKASLDKASPIGIGDKTLVLKGSLLDTIVSIHFLEKPIPFALSADKKAITVQLPDGFSSTPGIQVIEVFYTDKTSVRYEVPVQKK